MLNIDLDKINIFSIYCLLLSSKVLEKTKVKAQGQRSRSYMTFDLDIIRCTILDLSCLEAVPGLYDLRFKSYAVFAKVDFQKGEIIPISGHRSPSTE